MHQEEENALPEPEEQKPAGKAKPRDYNPFLDPSLSFDEAIAASEENEKKSLRPKETQLALPFQTKKVVLGELILHPDHKAEKRALLRNCIEHARKKFDASYIEAEITADDLPIYKAEFFQETRSK